MLTMTPTTLMPMTMSVRGGGGGGSCVRRHVSEEPPWRAPILNSYSIHSLPSMNCNVISPCPGCATITRSRTRCDRTSHGGPIGLSEIDYIKWQWYVCILLQTSSLSEILIISVIEYKKRFTSRLVQSYL